MDMGLIDRLREDAEVHKAVANDCDCTPENTANWQHAINALDAADTLEKLRNGLENCRLFAARNRKEDWALLILGFCADAGVVGSVTR